MHGLGHYSHDCINTRYGIEDGSSPQVIRNQMQPNCIEIVPKDGIYYYKQSKG